MSKRTLSHLPKVVRTVPKKKRSKETKLISFLKINVKGNPPPH
jgi:hypothetical protein